VNGDLGQFDTSKWRGNFNIVFTSPIGNGKSSLVCQYAANHFQEIDPTLIDSYRKAVFIRRKEEKEEKKKKTAKKASKEAPLPRDDYLLLEMMDASSYEDDMVKICVFVFE
jgi:hypothetical protein